MKYIIGEPRRITLELRPFEGALFRFALGQELVRKGAPDMPGAKDIDMRQGVDPAFLVRKGAGLFAVIQPRQRQADTPTAALADLNLDIGSAHVVTFGEKANDSFYVRDLVGHKIEGNDRARKIRNRLIDVMASPVAREAAQ